MKLTACMIVKNEESCLENCLKTLVGFDEIIILDTGSNDSTCTIARKYTDKVYENEYKWEDDFSKARNHALSKCTGDWVLSIDADEILVEGGLKAIRDTVEANPEAFSLNLCLRSAMGTSEHRVPKLFRRCKEVFWLGAAHNYLSKRAVIDTGATTIYGYSKAHKKDPNRTLRILIKAVLENSTKPREMFYLAREYKYRKDFIGALYWYDQYLKLSTWAPEKADALIMKAQCLWFLRRGEEARAACLEAIRINPNFKEAYLCMSTFQPKYRERWIMFAELASNEDVLFIRTRPEEGVEHYKKLPDDLSRYDNLYAKVQELAGKGSSVLDVGCGKTAPLAKYFDRYDGFDFVENPIRIANAYDPASYTLYAGVYLAIEVLEHLDDIKVLSLIPQYFPIVFSVPSFYCAGHMRIYTPDIIEWRFRKLLAIESMTRFNLKDGKWVEGGENTSQYITLCTATKR